MVGDLYSQSPTAKKLLDIKSYVDALFGQDSNAWERNTISSDSPLGSGPSPEKAGEQMARKWFQNLPGRFRPYQRCYGKIPPKVGRVTAMRYPAGKAVVRDQRKVLRQLETSYRKLEETLDSYDAIIDCIGGVTWMNPVLGEILTKKTVRLLAEVGGSVEKYSVLCYDLQEPLELAGPGEGKF